MTDEPNGNRPQRDILKMLQGVGADLFGGALAGNGVPGEEDSPEAPARRPEAVPAGQDQPKPDIRGLWKTADETIDWTDALAHGTPTDGLTGARLWAFYHKHAEKVLAGDLAVYTEVLQKANPLGELTPYAPNITMQACSPDRLQACFTCNPELLARDRKLYLSAMALRIARDLLACLPVEEVAVTAEDGGKKVFSVTYTRRHMLHRNFAFTDPVALAEECGAEFG